MKINIYRKQTFQTRRRAGLTGIIALLWLIALIQLTMTARATAESAERSHRHVTSHGQVTAQINISPEKVSIDKTMLLSLIITAPSDITVTLPRIHDRTRGFTVNNVYDKEPITADGATRWERRAMLTPTISDQYRIAPMPVVYVNRSKSPSRSEWFPTKPIKLETMKIYEGTVLDSIKSQTDIRRLGPSPKTISLYILLIIFIITLLVAANRTARHIRWQRKLRQMSPQERALTLLDVLIEKNLIEKDQVKEFYFQLTMIVRRYIEEQYGIRAPEQTTDEFLKSVRQNSAFSQQTVEQLGSFLEAADLVKFAAHKPSKQTIDKSVQTAINYIKAGKGGEEQ